MLGLSLRIETHAPRRLKASIVVPHLLRLVVVVPHLLRLVLIVISGHN